MKKEKYAADGIPGKNGKRICSMAYGEKRETDMRTADRKRRETDMRAAYGKNGKRICSAADRGKTADRNSGGHLKWALI